MKELKNSIKTRIFKYLVKTENKYDRSFFWSHDSKAKTSQNLVEKIDSFKSLLPCIVVGIGNREHGQTFTKGNFHYKCLNATAEVIG